MKRYKTDFSEEELKKALHANEQEAQALIDNPDKWAQFKEKLEAFIRKAYKLPVIGGLIDDIVSMGQMVDSYVKKEYRDVPVTSIISAAGALIYVLSPIDLIPDAIPIVGYIDDAAVILLVLKLGVGHDLEKYKSWQDECRKDALASLEEITGKLIQELIGEATLGAIVLCSNNMFRVLAVDNDSIDIEETPYPARVYYLNLPTQILRDMFLESEKDYLDFMNGMIEHTDFAWSPVGKLSAVHEADYGQYEAYFALIERDA